MAFAPGTSRVKPKPIAIPPTPSLGTAYEVNSSTTHVRYPLPGGRALVCYLYRMGSDNSSFSYWVNLELPEKADTGQTKPTYLRIGKFFAGAKAAAAPDSGIERNLASALLGEGSKGPSQRLDQYGIPRESLEGIPSDLAKKLRSFARRR